MAVVDDGVFFQTFLPVTASMATSRPSNAPTNVRRGGPHQPDSATFFFT